MSGRLVLAPGEAAVHQLRGARKAFVPTSAQLAQLRLLKTLGARREDRAISAGCDFQLSLNPLILSVALVPKGLVGKVVIEKVRSPGRAKGHFWITPAGEALLEAYS